MMGRFYVVLLHLLCLLVNVKIGSSSHCPEWPSANGNIRTRGIHEGTCYIVFRDETKSWYEAKGACERNGWRLFHIKTPEKHEFYSSALRTIRSGSIVSCFWMGLSDAEKEGEWKWTDGSVATYELVETDFPLLTKWTYDCVAYCKRETGYRWAAKRCKEFAAWPYICDQDALETTTVPSTTAMNNKEISTSQTREPRKQTILSIQRIAGLDGTLLLSNSITVVFAITASVCARFCTSSKSPCVLFSYDNSHGKCVLHSTIDVLNGEREHHKGWTVWKVI